MVALFTGMVTATEAAAAVRSSPLVICGVRRKLTWKKLGAHSIDTLRISCMVFMIVAGRADLCQVPHRHRLPAETAAWISTLQLPRWVVLWMILLCYIVGGCIMDALAFLLVSLPIFYPLVPSSATTRSGSARCSPSSPPSGPIMPPIGICCFVVSGMNKDIPLRDVFKGAMYYIPAYLVAIALLMLFPKFMVSMLANLVR